MHISKAGDENAISARVLLLFLARFITLDKDVEGTYRRSQSEYADWYSHWNTKPEKVC